MFDAVSRVIRGLRSSNPKQQKNAYDRIWRLDVTPETGIRLIEAAGETFPNDGLVEGYKRINRDILRSLWNNPHQEFAAAIERVYDHLVDKEEAREHALRLLTEIHTRESLGTLARLLKRPSSETVDLDYTFVPLIGSEEWDPKKPPLPEGTALFPDVLDVLDHERHAPEIYRVIIRYVESGLLHLAEYPRFVQSCLARSRESFDQFANMLQVPGQPESSRPELTEQWWEQFEATKFRCERLLRLLPLLESSAADDILQQVLHVDFPIHQTMAALGLLKRNQPVDPQLLETLAAGPGLRAELWYGLYHIDKLAAFPARYRDQLALAEGELVRWLLFPTEMGRLPEELELLTVHRYEDPEQGPVQSFFFKFRRGDFLDGKWFVGMAGPYPLDGEPTMYARWTFSHFLELESQDLDAHIRSFLEEDEGPNEAWDITGAVDN